MPIIKVYDWQRLEELVRGALRTGQSLHVEYLGGPREPGDGKKSAKELEEEDRKKEA
jgi:hypothetical protein